MYNIVDYTVWRKIGTISGWRPCTLSADIAQIVYLFADIAHIVYPMTLHKWALASKVVL